MIKNYKVNPLLEIRYLQGKKIFKIEQLASEQVNTIEVKVDVIKFLAEDIPHWKIPVRLHF